MTRDPGEPTAAAPGEPTAASPVERAERSITRRRFLRRTLAGAALIAVGGTIAKNTTGYDAGDPALGGLRVLSLKEAIIFRAAARRLLAPDEIGGPTPDEIDVVGAADAYLTALPDDIVSDVRALLHLVEHTPVVFTLRPARFTRLPPAAQDAVLDDWATSRLAVRRQGFAALKALAMLGYYGDPRTFAIAGFPGPLLPR